MSPSSCSRTKTSRTARESPSSIVKRSRSQSSEAPSALCCSPMRLPYFSFHAQTRFRNSSRPRSWRLFFSVFLSSFSTIIWVAMPAWSVPGSQSVLKPLIFFQRMSTSWSVAVRAWPRWSEPVTLGGGRTIEKWGREPSFSSPWKQPRSVQKRYQRASTSLCS